MASVVNAIGTMLRLTPRRRAVLADKVPDVINLVTGAVVIGFLVGEPSVSRAVLAGVFAAWGLMILFAVVVAEDQS